MLDLTDEVSVVVKTVGAPTFEACLDHLNRQDCRFHLEIITNVAPLSAALQKTLDICKTDFCIEVDEDMLLFPHAVRIMYETIVVEPDNLVKYTFPLYDDHLDTAIHGVSIWRHAVMARYPYRDVVGGGDWDHTLRLQRDGFVTGAAPLETATREGGTTLGLHGTYWTPLSIYERFRTLECKRRRFGGSAAYSAQPATPARLVDLGPQLLERFMAKRSELDLFALLGLLSGVLADTRDGGDEKNYHTYDLLPGFEAAQRFFDQVRQPLPPINGE